MPEHSTLLDPDIHEPKGISTSTSGDIYVSNGAGTGVWRPIPEFTGAMVITNNATPQALTAATDSTLATFSDYVQITGWAAGELDKITFATNQLTIPVGGGGLFLVDAYMNIASDTINSAVAIKFAVNGASGVTRRPRHFLAATGAFYNLAASGIVRLVDSDVVDLFVASDKTIGLTIQDSSFLLHKVGE